MIIKELTDEFVEIFGKPENRSSDPMWMLIRMKAPLPVGVDPNDPRVLRLLSEDLRDDEVVR